MQLLQPARISPDRCRRATVAHLGTSSVRYEVGLFAEDSEVTSAQGHFIYVYVRSGVAARCTDQRNAARGPGPDPHRVAAPPYLFAHFAHKIRPLSAFAQVFVYAGDMGATPLDRPDERRWTAGLA